MEHMITKAREMATKAHQGQKYGEEPYTVHLQAVAELARPFGAWAETLAWLHDAVEDTDMTLDDVEYEFGLGGRLCINLLTDEPGETRKIRKAATHAKLAQVEASSLWATALIVKACDRLANVRSSSKHSPGLLKMYRKEHEAFRLACYRPGLCDTIWEELEQILGA